MTMPHPSSVETSPNPNPKVLGVSPPVPSVGEPSPASPVVAHNPPGLAPLPSLGALFQSLRQVWLLAFGAAIIGAAVTALILHRVLPYTFATTVWLRQESPRPSAASEETGDNNPLPNGPVHQVKNPLLLARVLDLPQVADLSEVRSQGQARTWLDENLQVETGGPTLVRLTLLTQQPDTGDVLVKKIVEIYQEQSREQRQTLLAQLHEHYQKLAAQSSAPTQGPLVVGPGASPAPSPMNPRLTHAEEELAKTRLELKAVQAELTVLQRQAQAAANVAVPANVVEELVMQDETIRKDRLECQRLEGLLVQIKKAAAKGDRDPYYIEKMNELTALREKVQQRQQEVVGKLEGQIQAKAREQHQAKIVQLAQRVDFLKELEKALVAELEQLKGEQVRPEPAAPRVQGSREPGKEEALRRLGAEIHLLEAPGADASGVEVCSDVETMTTQGGPRSRTICLSAGMVFLALLVSLAWLEFNDRRVRTPRSVTQGLQLPVAGVLPAGALAEVKTASERPMPLRPPTNLHALAHQNQLSESADVVRTLVLKQLGDKPGVVLVASSRGGEGATSVACQLALSLARGWRRTLLIDGHVRQPSIHTRFQVGLEPGLCEVLRGEMDAPDAVQPAKVSRLWVLPAGNWDNHALQSLAQDSAAELIESFKDQYDVVVIDAGPLLPLADALLLAQHADMVILSALVGVSRLPRIHEARQRLATLDVPFLGVVVNGVPTT
jgi:polysaccharide biosynthesis transport protein